MIKKIAHLTDSSSMILLLENKDLLPAEMLTREEYAYVNEQKEKLEKDLVILNRYDRLIVVQFIKKETSGPRRDGKIAGWLGIRSAPCSMIIK